MTSPIICAIDTNTVEQAKQLTHEIAPHIGMIKLGLEFFVAHGPQAIEEVTQHGTLPFFLDLKLHDIPNTVAGGVKAACKLKPNLLTIHAQGGVDMMKAAVEAATGDTKLLAVTLLTSLDQTYLTQSHIAGTPEDYVLRLAEMVLESGMSGCVCSPHEITPIRKRFGDDLMLVTPGIRPAGSDKGDQKRVMTPKQAVNAGANYLVIGRPITQSQDKQTMINNIHQSL